MTEVGTITRVQFDTDGPPEVKVDVRISPNIEHENIRYRSPGKGVWVVPEVGDIVEVSEAGSRGRVAHSARHQNTQTLPDNISEGDVVFELNGNTRLHFNKQGDGTYNVSLDCDGALQFTAADIFIGEDGNRKRVATEDHTHTFEYTGGGDNSSTLSGTTDGPDDITDTEVE